MCHRSSSPALPLVWVEARERGEVPIHTYRIFERIPMYEAARQIFRPYSYKNFGIPSRWNLFPRVPLRGKCTRRHILLCRIKHTSIFGGFVGRKERMLVFEDGIFDGIYIRRKLVLLRWNIEKFHAQEICKRCMLGTDRHTLLAYKSSNHGRRRLPSSSTANISDPTTMIIAPA